MQRALKNWITVFQNWFSSICNSGYESTVMMGWQSLNGTNPIWKGRGRLLKLYLHATQSWHSSASCKPNRKLNK